MSDGPDIEGMVQDDIAKVKSVSGNGGMDTSLPALMELAFASLTGVTAVVWFLAILLVPDTIDGITWMSLGALGLVLFGLPAGLLYLLRRGGATVIRDLVRSVVR